MLQAELADEQAAAAKVEREMKMVEHATDLSNNLPEAIRNGAKLEHALSEYKEILRKVSTSDLDDTSSPDTVVHQLQRSTLPVDQPNSRITHSMLRGAEVGKRMELVVCLLAAILLLEVIFL